MNNTWNGATNEDLLRAKSELDAVTSTSGATDALAALKYLDSLNLSIRHLEDTKIGFAVRRMKKHSNAAVAQLAERLTQKWKGTTSMKFLLMNLSAHACHIQLTQSLLITFI